MKISDREKKLVLGVLLIAIIALPIFFFIKPKIESTNDLDAELVTLNERYEYLKALYEKKDFYEAEIKRLLEERTKLIENYAEGILQENTIMFLRAAEEKFNLEMTVLDFSEDEKIHICDGYVDEDNNKVEGLDAYKDSVSITYRGDYEQVKKFIDYIFNNKEKMLLSNISMSNGRENVIEGTFVFDQFAITGEGRSLDQVTVPKMPHTIDRVFPFVVEETDEDDNTEDTMEY